MEGGGPIKRAQKVTVGVRVFDGEMRALAAASCALKREPTRLFDLPASKSSILGLICWCFSFFELRLFQSIMNFE